MAGRISGSIIFSDSLGIKKSSSEIRMGKAKAITGAMSYILVGLEGIEISLIFT